MPIKLQTTFAAQNQKNLPRILRAPGNFISKVTVAIMQFALIGLIFDVQTTFAQSSATTAEKDGGSMFSFIFSNLPLWITAVVVFALSLVLGAVVKSIVENRLAGKIDEDHQEVLIISGRVAFVCVVIVGTSISLAIAGINITSLLAAVGFGISFGLQDTISNFVAGIALLASRPFTIGDWIKINGNTGKVVEIRTRATYLSTYDGLRLIVPNAQLYKSQVLSYTSNPMRRLKVPVYCRYGVDIKDVITICLKELRKNPKIFLEPKPNVIIDDLADSYISLQVRFWVDSKGMWRRIQSSIFMKIQNRLEEAGLDSPYAITSLSMEPDIESVMLKTKNLDPDELTKIMNERMAEEEKLANRRKELTKPEPVIIQPQTVDQSGGMFLKGTENGQFQNLAPAYAQDPNQPAQNPPLDPANQQQIYQTPQN